MFGLSRSELTGVLILMRRDEICPLFFSRRGAWMPARYSHVITVGLHRRAPWGLFCLVFLGGVPCFPFGCGNGMDRYLYYLALSFWRCGQSCTLVCM
jgi:hypothetical protein